MTIQVPGFFEEIKPGLAGMGEALQNYANPDWQRQKAVRDAILAGRIKPDDLNNMGSDEVTKVFGAGTGGFAAGAPNAAHIKDTASATEWQRILKLPPGRERNDAMAALTGTPTATQRAQADANLDNTTTGTAVNKTILDDKRTATERKAAADAVAAKVHVRMGQKGIRSLYQASQSGLLTPEEHSTLIADPIYATEYKVGQDEYHQRVQEQLMREGHEIQRTGNRMAMEEWKSRNDYQHASNIAEKYGGNTDAIGRMLKADPKAVQDYIKMDKSPTDTEGALNWEAAKAINSMRTDKYGKRFNDADREFRLATQAIDKILYNPSMHTEDAIRSALNEKNIIAKKTYGDAGMKNEDIPEWKYDAGPNGHMWSAKTYYRAGGDPAQFGTGETYVLKEKDAITRAAEDAIAGKKNISELLAKAPSPEIRNQLQTKYDELKKNPDSTTPPPSGINLTPDTTGAARVKTALDVAGTTAPVNLNVGRDVADSVNTGSFSKVIKYMTQDMSPSESSATRDDLLRMSSTERERLIKSLKEKGKI